MRGAVLAALAALVAAAPLAAQDSGEPDGLRGVWHGTLGSQAITACFEGEECKAVALLRNIRF